MRQEARFTPGPARLSAARLNALEARLKRLENFRVNKRYLRLTQDASGPYLDILPFADLIVYTNTGTATITGRGLLELTTWHDDRQSWDAQRPSSPGLVKIAVNAEIDVAAGDSGIAYASGDNLLVLADTDVGTADISGRWLTTQKDSSTALSIRARTQLKVIASQATNLWYCRFTGSLG